VGVIAVIGTELTHRGGVGFSAVREQRLYAEPVSEGEGGGGGNLGFHGVFAAEGITW